MTVQELQQWDRKNKDLLNQLQESGAQKKQLELQLQNMRFVLAEKTKLIET